MFFRKKFTSRMSQYGVDRQVILKSYSRNDTFFESFRKCCNFVRCRANSDLIRKKKFRTEIFSPPSAPYSNAIFEYGVAPSAMYFSPWESIWSVLLSVPQWWRLSRKGNSKNSGYTQHEGGHKHLQRKRFNHSNEMKNRKLEMESSRSMTGREK